MARRRCSSRGSRPPRRGDPGPDVAEPGRRADVGAFVRTQRIESANHWFQTCNIAYPRTLLERLGGFDERFTEAAGEDVDLGWRARDAGAAVEFTDTARVLHAVDDLGPLGYLRLARRGADSALMFRLHPELRRSTAYAGIFWKRAHARLLLALAGVLLARRLPAGPAAGAPVPQGPAGPLARARRQPRCCSRPTSSSTTSSISRRRRGARSATGCRCSEPAAALGPPPQAAGGDAGAARRAAPAPAAPLPLRALVEQQVRAVVVDAVAAHPPDPGRVLAQLDDRELVVQLDVAGLGLEQVDGDQVRAAARARRGRRSGSGTCSITSKE